VSWAVTPPPNGLAKGCGTLGKERDRGRTHPATKDLVNSCGLLERALLDDRLAHLFHEDHEGVERLLDVLASSSSRTVTWTAAGGRLHGRRAARRRRRAAAAAGVS